MKIRLLLLSFLMVAVIPSSSYPFHPLFQKGFTFTSWGQNDYLTSTSDDSLLELNQTGTQHVALLVTWYQDTSASTVMYSDGGKTPSDAALVHAINQIHGLGMKVMLKPHIDVKDGSWRGYIVPSDWNSWFLSYASFINHYADLATQNDVEQFCVGTELKATTGRTSDWESIVSGVRSRYSGPITYAANWDNYHAIAWWACLDYIGIDAYFPLTGKSDPTLQELKNAWASRRNSLSGFSSTWGKDIIFTEIGYQSIDGTNMHPYDWQATGSVDEQEQADCYRAALETFWNDSWLKGMYWWDWYYDVNDDHDSYGIWNKRAESILYQGYHDGFPVDDGDARPYTIPTIDLSDTVNLVKQWNDDSIIIETGRSTVSGWEIYDFYASGTGEAKAGIQDNYSPGGVSISSMPPGDAGSGDLTGFGFYTLMFQNPNDTPMSVNIHMNTGLTGLGEENQWVEGSWTNLSPGDMKSVTIDLSEVNNLNHVTNIGFQVMFHDAEGGQGQGSGDLSVKVAPNCDFDLDGYVSDFEVCGGSDCDDTDAEIRPGATEVCDNVDNDCSGIADDGLEPTPSTCGIGECATLGTLTCVAGTWVDNCSPGVPGPEICDGRDNDCDGAADEGLNCGGVCAGSGVASTLGISLIQGVSDLGKQLAYLLLPIGAVIALGFWRRNR